MISMIRAVIIQTKNYQLKVGHESSYLRRKYNFLSRIVDEVYLKEVLPPSDLSNNKKKIPAKADC